MNEKETVVIDDTNSHEEHLLGIDEDKPVSLWHDVLKILCVVAIFVIIALILRHFSDTWLSIKEFRSILQTNYKLGVIWFLTLASIMAGFGIPRLVISTLAGALFGAVGGFIWGIIASLGGATINFYWARLFMRGAILRHLPKRMIPWYNKFNEKGFKYMLYLRLFPLSNSTATNTMGGVSRMNYFAFIAATIIGWVPLAIVFSTFGSSAAKQNYWQLLIGVVVLIAVFCIERLVKKFAKRDINSHNN